MQDWKGFISTLIGKLTLSYDKRASRRRPPASQPGHVPVGRWKPSSCVVSAALHAETLARSKDSVGNRGAG